MDSLVNEVRPPPVLTSLKAEAPLPPPLRPKTRTPIPDLQTRRAVTLSFWAVAVLALPYWYYSTAITRLPLPTAQIAKWTARAPCYLRPPVTVAPRSFPKEKIELVTEALLEELPQESAARCFDLHVTPNPQDPNRKSYELQLVAGFDAPSIYDQRTAHVSANLKNNDDLLDGVLDSARQLLDLTDRTSELDPRVAKFVPKYKLVFSLLNQDANTGEALLKWDVHELLRKHLAPLLKALAPLHTFDIETQIQYYAPLSVDVTPAEEGTFVEEGDLKAFVNPAGWNIASPLSLDPVLNFVLYVPSVENRPMRIRTSAGAPPNTPNAFLTPRWGGVVIYNPPPSSSFAPDLSLAFTLFEQHLLILLGLPASIAGGSPPDTWQIDGLIRRRLEEATRETMETLEATVKLVGDIQNMNVGKEVQQGVQAALAQLALAEATLPESPSLALAHVANASALASKAYFDPSMLGLLYFPDEHKYAVYTPLFGPIAVPMLAALLREWREWKRARKEKKEKERAEKAAMGLKKEL